MNQLYLQDLINTRKIVKRLNNEKEKLISENNELKSTLKKYRYLAKGINYYDGCKKTRDAIDEKLINIISQVNSDFSQKGVKIGDFTVAALINDDFLPKLQHERFVRSPISAEKALFIKDLNFFSDDDYSNIRIHYNADIPIFEEIRLEREKQNNDLFEKLVKLNDKCYFMNVKENISKHIEHYLKQENNKHIKKIRIKLCADGARISRNVDLINFCFTILDDKESTSCKGHHTLGIGRMKENYDELKINSKLYAITR